MTDGGLRDVDANLLLPLHALLEERNLTHAGTRMAMSQPAMSGALARLRKHFGDELLVRAGRGFELTPLAEQLRPFVADAVEAAEGLLGHPRGFDPRTSRKRFEVSMSEYAMTVLSEPLTRLLCEQAPACSVAFDSVPPSWDRFESQLMRRDLIVVPLGFDFPGIRQPIYSDELACLVSRGNPYLKDGSLTQDDLLAMPHAVAHFLSAGDRQRPLEREMQRRGLQDRTVLVQVDQPADPAVRARRHEHVRVRAEAPGRCAAWTCSTWSSPTRPWNRSGSSRRRTGTRAAPTIRRESGCAGCCTTSPSTSRMSEHTEHDTTGGHQVSWSDGTPYIEKLAAGATPISSPTAAG